MKIRGTLIAVFVSLFILTQTPIQKARADGVSVSSPQQNAVVGSPFSLQAKSSTCQNQPVSSMAYSIGSGANSPAVYETNLSAQVTLTTGENQILHVKSWGDKGAGCDQDVTVNVVPANKVNVLTPANGSHLSSPFTLQAQAASCDGQPVATMAYSIGSGANSTPVNGTSLTTQVVASAGLNQVLHVKAWGNQGAGCDADISFSIALPVNGVSVTAPTANASVTSPFNLKAQSTFCSGQPVSAMAYSIGDGANSAPVSGTSLNTQVSAASGSNQILHVKSWGNQGAGCDTDVTITIGGSGFGGSANIPNPPSNAINSTEIQQLTGWTGLTGAASQCPNGVPSPTCNPVNANFDATVTHPGDPAYLNGSSDISGEFQFYSGPAWATAIWGHSLFTLQTARNFIWDFYVYVDASNYQASELDLYTSLNNGQRFMMGSQCNRGNNTWDTWSESTQSWIHNSSIPCNSVLTSGSWHHITFYNTVDSTHNTYTYHTLRIDNVDYVLNQSQSTQYVGWPDGLIGVQVQTDANASGTGVNESIENMQVYAW